MNASLCINVLSGSKTDVEEIRFFEAEDWGPDTEKQLLGRIQELFYLVRNLGKKIDIVIKVEVSDLPAAVFLLNKKKEVPTKINHQKLSIREIEILGLIMDGLTNQEIAEKLFIGYETVRTHRKNILEKTGAKNTAALINHFHQTFFEK